MPVRWAGIAPPIPSRRLPLYGDGYTLDNSVGERGKLVTGVTLFSGRHIPVPLDMGEEWDFFLWVNLGATAPAVGDTYTYKVRYGDGLQAGARLPLRLPGAWRDGAG